MTDFYKSLVTDALCITISTPVRNQIGEIKGVFGVDLKFEDVVKIDRRMGARDVIAGEKGGVEGEII